MRELAITAVGTDRPGIVAGLTHALLEVGANLQECRAALLRGSFAVVMAVEVPAEIDAATAHERLAPAAAALGLQLLIADAADTVPGNVGERCVISVYGADHPGIVHAVSRALAELGVNIIDLSSRVVGEDPVYVLGIEAERPAGVPVADVRAALAAVGAEQHVDVMVTVDDEAL